MDTLRDGPKHGYEIIKALEEKSGGQYAPSPGTVYPTLQMLEDQGLVRSEQQAERRVYSLTEAGQAELKTRIEEVNAFHQRWKDEKGSPALQAEVGFLRDELELLARTVWSGVQTLSQADDPETVRPLRKAIEECRNEIRTLIATRSTIKGENV
jgi:DNA-binding PadR family transcriptional regulator